MRDMPTAFPWTHDELTCTGMTLRDYFAAKAMQGMYASHDFPTGSIIDTAEEAYEMADAMLEARKNDPA